MTVRLASTIIDFLLGNTMKLNLLEAGGRPHLSDFRGYSDKGCAVVDFITNTGPVRLVLVGVAAYKYDKFLAMTRKTKNLHLLYNSLLKDGAQKLDITNDDLKSSIRNVWSDTVSTTS